MNSGTTAVSMSVMGGSIHYSDNPKELEANKSPAASKGSPSRKIVRTLVVDKTLAGAANLSKLLPTGTFLSFQVLSPTFSNRGRCCTSNQYLTCALLFTCALFCGFFTFTDSLAGSDGQIYYGVATSKGLCVFNFAGGREEWTKAFGEERLRRLRRQWVDWLHAVFGVLLFLALAFSDSDVQSCLFLEAGDSAKQLLVNIPLGASLLASLVFMIFPTSRKGFGYSNE